MRVAMVTSLPATPLAGLTWMPAFAADAFGGGDVSVSAESVRATPDN